MTTETKTGLRISILQESLQRALSVVTRASATRTTLAITQNVLLQSDAGRLRLACTDLDIAITAYAGAMIHNEGGITVSAKQFADIINGLPQCTVQLEVDVERRRLVIEGARTSTWLATMDAEDFPRIVLNDEGPSFELEPKALARALERTGPCVAADNSRPELTGVNFKAAGKSLRLAAADGFRLVVADVDPVSSAPADLEIILPRTAVRELGRLAEKSSEPLRLTLNESRTQARFDLPEIALLSSLVQGQFPNYSQLIPTNPVESVSFDATELRHAADGPARIAADGGGILRLRTRQTDGVWRLSVEGRADELGASEAQIDIGDARTPLKVAMNSRYFHQALAAFEGKAWLDWWSASSSVVFRPGDDSDRLTYVVMPMFVQWD